MSSTPSTRAFGDDNLLYYGDNLSVLREHTADGSIDLVYLDPPFNSNRDYNVLYGGRDTPESAAQVQAFADTWCWDDAAEGALNDVLAGRSPAAADLLTYLTRSVGRTGLTAYLAMMAPRLIELHRVLTDRGSLYLHCDTAAAHYLKLMLDAVFGARCYRNHITWKRTTAHNNPRRYGRVQDVILFYTRGDAYTFHARGGVLSDVQRARYKYQDADGRAFKAENLTAPGRHTGRADLWRGVDPGAGRSWAKSLEERERLLAEGRILLQADGRPRKDGLKVYLDEAAAPALQDLWTDIDFPPTSGERLGYPTQKPLALLERIIRASSNPGDVVLDPFCGCGTAVVAAETLGRRWIGVDITHLAIDLVERRLEDRFGADLRPYRVIGNPVDEAGARALARHDRWEFEWWAVGLVGARPANDRKRGADGGIDGIAFFRDGRDGAPRKVVVQVKSGAVGRRDIAALIADSAREKAEIAVLVTLEAPTKPMLDEARAAGTYQSPAYADPFARVQVYTVAELLQGAKPRWPRLNDATFARAHRAKARARQTTISTG